MGYGGLLPAVEFLEGAIEPGALDLGRLSLPARGASRERHRQHQEGAEATGTQTLLCGFAHICL